MNLQIFGKRNFSYRQLRVKTKGFREFIADVAKMRKTIPNKHVIGNFPGSSAGFGVQVGSKFCHFSAVLWFIDFQRNIFNFSKINAPLIEIEKNDLIIFYVKRQCKFIKKFWCLKIKNFFIVFSQKKFWP